MATIAELLNEVFTEDTSNVDIPTATELFEDDSTLKQAEELANILFKVAGEEPSKENVEKTEKSGISEFVNNYFNQLYKTLDELSELEKVAEEADEEDKVNDILYQISMLEGFIDKLKHIE